MTRVRLLGSLACALLPACIAPVAVDELDVDDAERLTARGHRTIPDARDPVGHAPRESAPPPATDLGPPRLRLAARPADADDTWCEAEIIAEGFPAIRQDGSQYVVVIEEIDAGADYDGRTVVQWREVEGDAIATSTEVADGEHTYTLMQDDPDRGCARARARVAAAIRPINDALRTGWRSLRPVPVQLPAPPTWYDEVPEPPAALDQRPVEVFHRNGYFIARVREAKVLQKLVKTDWLGESPEMTLDAYAPTIMGLYHDAESGFAIAELSYESASCMSDPTIYARPLALAPAVVAEAERRAGFVRGWDAPNEDGVEEVEDEP